MKNTKVLGRGPGSNRSILAMNWPIVEVSNRIFKTKLLKISREARTCRSPESMTSVIDSLMRIGSFETDLRRSMVAGRNYFLQNGCRNNWSTKLGPVTVSDVEMTGCKEGW